MLQGRTPVLPKWAPWNMASAIQHLRAESLALRCTTSESLCPMLSVPWRPWHLETGPQSISVLRVLAPFMKDLRDFCLDASVLHHLLCSGGLYILVSNWSSFVWFFNIVVAEASVPYLDSIAACVTDLDLRCQGMALRLVPHGSSEHLPFGTLQFFQFFCSWLWCHNILVHLCWCLSTSGLGIWGLWCLRMACFPLSLLWQTSFPGWEPVYYLGCFCFKVDHPELAISTQI